MLRLFVAFITSEIGEFIKELLTNPTNVLYFFNFNASKAAMPNWLANILSKEEGLPPLCICPSIVTFDSYAEYTLL